MNRNEKLQTLRTAMPGASDDEIVIAGAIAEHETQCGDAWPGEHNWGGLQMAKLSEEEHSALEMNGIRPSAPFRTEGASTLNAARSLLHREGGALHVDSSPTRGWYFVWFHSFRTDSEGAAFS